MTTALPRTQTSPRKFGGRDIGRGGYGGSHLVAQDFFGDDNSGFFPSWGFASQLASKFALQPMKGTRLRTNSSNEASKPTVLEDACKATARLLRRIHAGEVSNRDWGDWAKTLGNLPSKGKGGADSARQIAQTGQNERENPKKYVADIKLAWRRSYLASTNTRRGQNE